MIQRAEHAVVATGLATGDALNRRVVDMLRSDSPYNHVEGIVFSEGMRNPARIRDAITDGADFITHSAGMIAVMRSGLLPDSLESFGAPLPARKRDLIARSLAKRRRMHEPGVGVLEPADKSIVRLYDRSTIAETAIHPQRNLGNIPKIARFDAVNAANQLADQHKQVTLCYTQGDEFFQLTKEQIAALDSSVPLAVLEGSIHDELLIRPGKTWERYLAKLALYFDPPQQV